MSHFTVGVITRDPHNVDYLLRPYDENGTDYYIKELYMSKEDYIKICIKNARKTAIQELKNAHEFKDVYDSFMQDENMTVENFNKFLKEVGCKYDYDTLMGAWDD